jgi:hypothetical protein
MLDAAESQLVRLNRWVVIALMAVMAVLVFANVVSRYLFNFSIIWVEELTRYMMVWVGFIGSGLVLRFGAHIAVDVFQDLLPARAAWRCGADRRGPGVTFATMAWLDSGTSHCLGPGDAGAELELRPRLSRHPDRPLLMLAHLCSSPNST